jgi:iron(III) transport system substrate-binding protein
MQNRVKNNTLLSLFVAATLSAAGFGTATQAQEKGVLNLYSSRHYQTDEALYTNFEKLTGIKINRVEGPEDPLIERIKNEGDKTQADVLVTVDIGRIWRAEQMGLFAPVKSEILTERIPAELRSPDNLWFGFSTRARVILASKAEFKADEIKNYEDLANPKYKGKVCTRSGGHVYSLSLLSSIVAASGPAAAEDWAKGVVANFARAPKGGDTDQIKAVASGECKIAVANTYYFLRLLKSEKPEERAIAEKMHIIFPNQAGRGTHVNISGAGMLKYAKNKEAAVKFLEYLSSESAQEYFANGNNEFPAVNLKMKGNPQLAAMANFKRDSVNVGLIGKNTPAAQQIYDRAGYK